MNIHLTKPSFLITHGASSLRIRNAHHFFIAAMIVGIGFSPITALAISLMDLCTLPTATMAMVIPSLLITIGLCISQPAYARLMGHGFVKGIIAVTLYDCLRIPVTMLGWLNDFIPKIGIMLVGEGNQHFLVGYLWRYLGNGGGMGMAFVCALVLLKKHFGISHISSRTTILIALSYGVFVWLCLITTLLLSENGEEVMFAITPRSCLLSLLGHLVFGGSLGFLMKSTSQNDLALTK